LFELDSKHYLVIIDYFSRYIELTELRSQTANAVIGAMKCIFARHGIPSIVCSDNGPCYAADTFKRFAAEYGFQHQTSSPRFAQANGEAERGVQIAKNIMRKAADPHLALLAYRTTPGHTGYSPAQLLMGRQLRSTIPSTKEALTPATPNMKTVATKDSIAKQHQADNFNKRHRVQILLARQQGEEVWIPDLQCRATVIEALPHRSYILKTNGGHLVRRNARSLRTPLPEKRHGGNDVKEPVNTQLRVRVRDTPAVQPVPMPLPTPARIPGTTRAGRAIHPPQRLNL
jgi:hypothetical protein